jgi:hypothetical protein
MTTPTGTIKASDIRNEFGASGENNSVRLGAYRVSWYAGEYSQLPLDAGVPQGTSAISFGQLRNKKLNVVVDISGNAETRVNMRSKYDANSGVTVVGGFVSKPANPSGKRILVSVNKTIGSDSGSINNVALRTGTWGTSATLEVLLGSSAKVLGAGGKGGDFTATEYIIYETDEYGSQYEVGTDFSYDAGAGSPGSSAFGIDYPCNIINYGTIQNGFGGGGAGGFRAR